MATGVCSVMICCAAMAMACSPDEQKRLMVVPAVVTGQPAQIAALRATFMPVAPSGWAQPMNTSSISPGSIPALGDGVLDGVAAHHRAMGHVEAAAHGFGQARAGGRNDDGFSHGISSGNGGGVGEA